MSTIEQEAEELRRCSQAFHESNFTIDDDGKVEAALEPTCGSMSGGQTLGDVKMWAVQGQNYFPCESTIPTLPPGQYAIGFSDQRGVFFIKKDICLDELIILPDSASEEILNGIIHFWAQEKKFREFGFLWKRGLLLWGPAGSGKCLGKDTPIIMYDGSIKMVQDIKTGELLMGDDNLPRTVLSTTTGREQLYQIKQKYGDSYVVNESHVLSLIHHKSSKRNKIKKWEQEHIDISLKNYIQQSNNFRHHCKGYKIGVNFLAQDIPLDPYFVGLWIGDGTKNQPCITTADEEVMEYLQSFAKTFNLNVRIDTIKPSLLSNNRSKTICLTKLGVHHKGNPNPIAKALRNLGLYNNKTFIPNIYKFNSTEVRLNLLAGLLDSDGWMGGKCFTFTSVVKTLAEDVLYLTRSLGFRGNIKQSKTITNLSNGAVVVYYQVNISGFTNNIPTKIKRKQAEPRKQKKNPLHYGVHVERIGVGKYYGFELNGNGRFLLGDFTVTHNTSLVQLLSKKIVDLGGFSVYVDNPEMDAKGLEILRRIEPTRPIVVMIEDIDAIIRRFNEATVLALFDGELQIDNVVYVATTNYPGRLDPRIINRPSRFDVVKKIGMPSAVARMVYLKHKHPTLPESVLERWVNETEDFSFAHLKEVIVAVECLGQKFEDAITRLREMMKLDILPEFGEDYKKKRSLGFTNGGGTQ